MEEIINNYSGDKLIPELFLIDYLQDYEGMDITSACTSVSLFLGYYYIQKCIVDISIPKAVKELSKFFDYLSEKGYIDRDGCAEAKEQMKRRTPEWVQQEKDWETMDYDEYNEKYWGLIF